MIGRKWWANRTNPTPSFDYSQQVRKVMYTTNAIAAIKAMLRNVTKKRGAFPTPDSVSNCVEVGAARGGCSDPTFGHLGPWR